MCGGRGTRLEADVEKPLFTVDDVPMIDRIRRALADSPIENSYAVVSPNAPQTRDHVAAFLPTIETAGDGYVDDLQTALAHEKIDPPVLTTAADLPLLDGDAIDQLLAAHSGGSLTACVPASLKRQLGLCPESTFDHDGRMVVPAGINIVDPGGEDSVYLTHDVRFAVNVNRRFDATVAEDLL
ncbi:MAG: NTP transferase domain-containing protein [Halobacteriales archaeon]|nr:NTP transferase domain-containing protein [Halobacteriales archaeon]